MRLGRICLEQTGHQVVSKAISMSVGGREDGTDRRGRRRKQRLPWWRGRKVGKDSKAGDINLPVPDQ